MFWYLPHPCVRCKVCISTAMSLHGSTCSSDASLDCVPPYANGDMTNIDPLSRKQPKANQSGVEKWQRIHQKERRPKKKKDHDMHAVSLLDLHCARRNGGLQTLTCKCFCECVSLGIASFWRVDVRSTHTDQLKHYRTVAPSLSLSHHLCVTTSICPLSLSHHLSLSFFFSIYFLYLSLFLASLVFKSL